MCPVLFTLDCRHTVAVKLDEATLACVVACMEQCDVQSTRSKKRPRTEWVSLKHPELLWSYQRSAVYVVYSDADGQWHRRFKKPYAARPEDNTTAEAMLEEASNELHLFYVLHHKGLVELRTAPSTGRRRSMTRSIPPFERASYLAQRLCRIESRRGGALARIVCRGDIS